MKPLIVYFHGLGSSPRSDKVSALSEAGTVVAPSINIDPDIAEAYLDDYLRLIINTHRKNGGDKVIFVGTSLGGFWAARMGQKWDATQILVNPSMEPEKSLWKYVGSGYTDYNENVKKSLTYEDIEKFSKYSSDGDLYNRHFFIAEHDPVVTPCFIPDYHPYVRRYDSDDHQGNSFFDDVVSHIISL